ncbi:hypothetical protein ACU8V7_14285 [Zobellia nedashkovskayae]
MGLFETLLNMSERKRTTDFNKIKVTSNGTFYMKSEDIFDDKEKSLKLINKLRESVRQYKLITETPKKENISI